MSLVFEDELYDMTSTAKDVLTSDDIPWRYQGSVIFEEVPYFGYRADLVTVQFKVWDAARRLNAVGNLTPLPDARYMRRSYRALRRNGPMTRHRWVHEDTTYRTEQTAREAWDWLADHGYLRPVADAEVGGQQRLPINDAPDKPLYDDHVPAVAVQFPDILSVNAWELKQRDWEQAIRQSMREDCFADHRWVVLDAGTASEAWDEGRSQFNDAGVGLMSLDEDGFEILRYPDGVTPPETQTRHLLNERALAELPDDIREEIEEKADEL